MSLSAKREALARIHGRYERAGRPHKSRILEEFCATCGYHRKAALRLLNRPLRTTPPKRSGPKLLYEPAAVLPVLKAIRLFSDQLCSKLLKAALPEWLEHHERRTAPLPEALRKQLLKISPAQIDRLLRPSRLQHPKKGISATRPGTLLRHEVPTRGGPPDTTRPGSVEADTVAHCDDSTEGDYVNSLTFTELYSGWTENRAVWNKSAASVLTLNPISSASLPKPPSVVPARVGRVQCRTISHLHFYPPNHKVAAMSTMFEHSRLSSTVNRISAGLVVFLGAAVLSAPAAETFTAPGASQSGIEKRTGGAIVFPDRVPDGFRLVYDQRFAMGDALADFRFTDPTAWRLAKTNDNAALELVKQSRYAPIVRSPVNIALIADKVFGDFVLEADLIQTGKEYGHRDMCLFFGFQSPTNFYYAHIATAADKNAHNIFIVNSAPRTNIAKETTKGVNWGLGVWHKVRLERSLAAGTIKVYFDDLTKPIMVTEDKTLGAGQIGFGSFDDTGMVDNIRIWSPKAEERKTGFFKATGVNGQ